jgi:hypothetical protein
MKETMEVTFNNEVAIRVQAQIFTGSTLISTAVTGPGESCILPAGSTPYDIFLKNGATGWELVRKMASEAKTVTLRQLKGRYVLSGS